MTTTYDIRKGRGIPNLTQFSINLAGDVGYGVTGKIVGGAIASGNSRTLLLDGGQPLDIVVDVATRIKQGKYQAYEFTAFETGAMAFKKSLKQGHHFLTMTEAEWAGKHGLSHRLTKRGERDDLVYHIKFDGDEFGREGWTVSEVISELAGLVGMEVVCALNADPWAPDVFVPAGDSVLRIVLELVSSLDPIFEFADSDVLVIRPRPPASGAAGLTGGTAKITRSTRAESTRFAANALVKVDGGIGPMRLDKIKTDVDTGFVYPINRWDRLWDKESFRVRQIIAGIRWQGRVEVDEVETESEVQNERRVESRFWLLSPTGDRVVELASRTVIYDTSGFFEEVKGLKETVHLFEGLNWSIRAPRPIQSITVISGKGWGDPTGPFIEKEVKVPVDSADPGGTTKMTKSKTQIIGVATSRWYSPLSMTVTNHTWPDDAIGVQESEIKTETAVLGTSDEAPADGEVDDRTWVRIDDSMSPEQAATLREVRPDCDNKDTNLVKEIETKYTPISPEMYAVLRTRHQRIPKFSKETISYKIALSDMPQHPLALRGMGVYYEDGVGGEGVKDTPAVTSYQPAIVDWDDIDAFGAEAAKERGQQYESSVDIAGGIIMLPRGMPVSIDGEINGELIGMSIALDAKSGLRTTAIIKQRQVA